MEILHDILKQAGLDETESQVYTTLLDSGALTILALSQKSGLKRTNLYNVLETLEKKNLVKKINKTKTTQYAPNPPRAIQELLQIKEDQIEFAKNTYEALIGSLQSKYALVDHKPLITYFEGLPGLQKVYQDILDAGEDLLLFRSTYDDKRKDVDRLIQKQITEQIKRNIHAKVISPPESDSKKVYTQLNKIHLVDEHYIYKYPLALPAQILIYGQKTAISTVRKDIIITLIDNKDITDTFRELFKLIWEYSTIEHEELVKGWGTSA